MFKIDWKRKLRAPTFRGRTLLGTCLVCLAAGVALGYTLGHKFPFQSNKDIWDITTSVATAAAVIVALWISNRQTREASQAATDTALIVAANLVDRLNALASQVSTAKKALEAYDDALVFQTDVMNSAKFDVFSNPALDLPPELIAMLAPIRGRAAVNVARGLSYLEGLGSEFRQATAQWGHLSDEERRIKARTWAMRLAHAHTFLVEGIVRLQRDLGIRWFPIPAGGKH